MKYPFCGFTEEFLLRKGREVVALMALSPGPVWMDARGNLQPQCKDSVIMWTDGYPVNYSGPREKCAKIYAVNIKAFTNSFTLNPLFFYDRKTP